AWIYRLISQGRFPKQVKIGSRAIAFVDPPICCALMSAALASG
ncbi:helix-turn-helix transcriptional regulator, partial [Escherichia coli]